MRKKTRVPMKVIKARSNKYKFSVKIHPMKAIISVGLGVISSIMLIFSLYLSWKNKGDLGIMIGVFGILAFIIAISGCVIAAISLKQRNIDLRVPVTGIILNGLLTIIYIAIYAMGTLL